MSELYNNISPEETEEQVPSPDEGEATEPESPDSLESDKDMIEISSDTETGDITFIFHVGDKESAPQDRAGAVSVLDSIEPFGIDDEPVEVDALLDEAADVGSVEFWVSQPDREKIEGWMI